MKNFPPKNIITNLSAKTKEAWKHSFSKDTMTLVRGTGVAQLILLISAPVFTRIFSPVDFGVYGIFAAIVVVISSLATLRYEIAVVLPHKKRDGGLLVMLSVFCSVFVTLLFFMVFWFSSRISGLYPMSAQQVRDVLIWGTLFVFVAGINQSLTYWNTRSKHFRTIAASKTVRASATVFSTITGGLLFEGPIGLIGGYVLGNMAAAVFLAQRSARDILAYLKENWWVRRMFALAKKYISYPKHNLPMGLMYALTQYLPVPMIAKLFGVDKAGYWMLTYRILYAPTILVGQSVMQTFYQRACELFNSDKDVYVFYLKITKALALIGFVPCLLFFYKGPYLFRIIFGESWGVSGAYARWVILYMYAWFVAIPSIMLTHVHKRQFFLMAVQALLLLSCVISFWAGALLDTGGTAAVAIYSLSGAAINFLIVFWMNRVSKKESSKRTVSI